MSASTITLLPKPIKPRRELLWLKEGKRCHWCGCATRLVSGDDWDQATTEHIIPRYKGGTNEESNLTSSCRRCNNRRSHEDACGLPDGHLLGKYKVNTTSQSPSKHVALTKDDKKALASRTSRMDILEKQREQALKEIERLRVVLGEVHRDDNEKAALLKQKDNEIAALRKQITEVTIIAAIRRKVANWLLTPDGK